MPHCHIFSCSGEKTKNFIIYAYTVECEKKSHIFKIKKKRPGMEVHGLNLRAWEAEASRSLSLKQVWSTKVQASQHDSAKKKKKLSTVS